MSCIISKLESIVGQKIINLKKIYSLHCLENCAFYVKIKKKQTCH